MSIAFIIIIKTTVNWNILFSFKLEKNSITFYNPFFVYSKAKIVLIPYLMNNNIKGLLLIIFGMLLFIVHDTLIKLTVNDLSLLQILAFRATVGSLILIFYLLYTKQNIVFSSAYPYVAIFRGVSFFFGFLLFFISLSKIGLAEATSLFFVSPFFITIFSYLILKNDK